MGESERAAAVPLSLPPGRRRHRCARLGAGEPRRRLGFALLLTLVAFVVAPDAPRDLTREAFIDPLVVARHAYLIVYSFALIFCAVAEYFVCAKRFADRGRPPGLAGLAPMAIFVAAAAHWFTPRSEGIAPPALPYVLDALTLVVVGWTIAELGFGASRAPWGGGR